MAERTHKPQYGPWLPMPWEPGFQPRRYSDDSVVRREEIRRDWMRLGSVIHWEQAARD